MHVLAGIYSCYEGEEGWRIVDAEERKVESPGVPEVTRNMCGMAYEWRLEHPSLESFVSDAKLIEVFLSVRSGMEMN